MYRIVLKNIEKEYEYNELIKIFLDPDDFILTKESELKENNDDQVLVFNELNHSDKNQIKEEIFLKLKELTGIIPPWGILTGVRPVKLTGELVSKLKDDNKVKDALVNNYHLKEEKADLLLSIYNYQQESLGNPIKNSAGLYVGIPFCPTRCLYCSFASNQKPEEEIERYMESLYREIKEVGALTKEHKIPIESIYIGGGTPTTLNEKDLGILIDRIKESFPMDSVKEFTVECGRPDTITREKLEVLKEKGIKRISINPQTLNDKTLELIGRNHKVEDFIKAYELAKTFEHFIINCDLILGLPGESKEDFLETLKKIIELDPANITIHTLAVKKASKLIEADSKYHYKHGDDVEDGLREAKLELEEAGYRPYYLYRQKNMLGALENTGYSKDDTPCLYNVRIMEEKQSILALGAGGISKRFYEEENRLERVPNVSNYEVYIDRLDEMIDRKKKDFFTEG